MFRSNDRHLQPALISNVNELLQKQRWRLEASWAGTFSAQSFSRVNVVVGLAVLKAVRWRA